jgi:hypothetical protein
MEIALAGDLVRLRQLQESDAEELWAATGNHADLWKWIWSIEPIPQSVEEMRHLITSMLAR